MNNLFLVISIFFGINVMGQNTPFKSLDNDEFAKILSLKDIQIVDARSIGEYNQGHLKNAINIDVNSPDLLSKIKTLNKSIPVAVYCRSGGRSKFMADKLSKDGFIVFELNGGITNFSRDSFRSFF